MTSHPTLFNYKYKLFINNQSLLNFLRSMQKSGLITHAFEINTQYIYQTTELKNRTQSFR